MNLFPDKTYGSRRFLTILFIFFLVLGISCSQKTETMTRSGDALYKVVVHQGSLRYVAEEGEWSEDELKKMEALLRDIEPRIKRCYGQPDLDNLEQWVVLRRLTDRARRIYNIESSVSAAAGIENAYGLPLIKSQIKDKADYKNHAVLFLSGNETGEVIAHELVHVFQGEKGVLISHLSGGGAWIEGIATFIGTVVGREIGTTGAHDYGTGFMLETFNKPQLASPLSWSIGKTCEALDSVRYDVAAYAWEEIFKEDQMFFCKLNEGMRSISVSKIKKQGVSALLTVASKIKKDFVKWHDGMWVFSTKKYVGEYIVGGAIEKDGLHLIAVNFTRCKDGSELAEAYAVLKISCVYQGQTQVWEKQADINGMITISPIGDNGPIHAGEITSFRIESQSNVADIVDLSAAVEN